MVRHCEKSVFMRRINAKISKKCFHQGDESRTIGESLKK
jgi:hypothetical protein